MSDVTSFDPYALPPEEIEEPPVSLWSALRKIGPGIVLAGTIVGSGELLLTTKLGADEAYSFLWLILFSCVVKVFVQTELGRYAISSGKPTLGAISDLPGIRLGRRFVALLLAGICAAIVEHLNPLGGIPSCQGLLKYHIDSFVAGLLVYWMCWVTWSIRSILRWIESGGTEVVKASAHWLAWWWLIMMLSTIFQLGAMTGTIGQALNLTFPAFSLEVARLLQGVSPSLSEAIIGRPEYPWAVLTCLTTIALLWRGDYRRIEIVTTALVVSVTLLTVTAALSLPFTKFPIHWPKVIDGLVPRFPESATGIAAAFAVFGITGVGAAELFYYPYWCLEKGYARCTGRRDDSEAWARRAKGWIRVMNLDAWVSMIVFTISTVSFYFMGAAVLNPQNEHPEGVNMIKTLSRMFIDSFGGWTRLVFLIGAAAVLFKTLYLSSAGNGRLAADFLGLAKFARYEKPEQRTRMIHWLSISIPVIAVTLFLTFKEPASMVVIGGFVQALTLPMISAATLYFRYQKLDRRLTPSLFMDICLWVAFVLITLVAGYAARDKIKKLLDPPAVKAAWTPVDNSRQLTVSGTRFAEFSHLI